MIQDARHVYAAAAPQRNEWALSGDWTIGKEDAVLNQNGGSIVYRFHARDLHLVLGPAADGKPVRFRVTIDGAPPGDRHGADVDADRQGVVTGQRLYQLIRQRGTIADHTFEIEFLGSRRPGLRIHLRLKWERTDAPITDESHRAGHRAVAGSGGLAWDEIIAELP